MSSEDEWIEYLEKGLKEQQRKQEAKARDSLLRAGAADAHVRAAKAGEKSEREVQERKRDWEQRSFEDRIARVKASCKEAIQWLKPRLHYFGGYTDIALERMESELAKDFTDYQRLEEFNDLLQLFKKQVEHRFSVELSAGDPVYSGGRDLVRTASNDCMKLQTEMLKARQAAAERRRPASD